jgi:hypothetical protein
LPPKFDKIRFELNVPRPDLFWIADVTISEIRDGRSGAATWGGNE